MNKRYKEEFDKLIDEWNKDEEYIIFGDGSNLEYFLDVIKTLKVKYFVDNDLKKQNNTKNNYKIHNPNFILQEENEVKIVIASDSFYDIAKQLNSMGLKENINYISYSKLLSLWKWYYEKKVYLMRTDLMVTPMCTLRCKNCNMYMPYYSNPQHKKFDDIKKDVDLYFNVVDYVVIFQMLGGEVFLHPNLYEILNYICERYRDRIKTLQIVSNGTILPSEKILDLCNKYNILFSISDYSENINYKEKLDKYIKLLDDYHIKYRVTKSDWADFGSPIVEKNSTTEQLKSLFNNCRAPFRGLGDKKIYYCHLNYSAVLAGIFPENKNDYFDLDSINGTTEEVAIELLGFDMGKAKAGYITFCKNCNGCGGINQNIVKAAIQIVKK